MTVHDIKVWPEFFPGLLDRSKSFEVRNNDRDYKVGDVLMIREWDPSSETYTGRRVLRRVTYVLDPFRPLAWENKAILAIVPEPAEVLEVPEALRPHLEKLVALIGRRYDCGGGVRRCPGCRANLALEGHFRECGWSEIEDALRDAERALE